MKKAGPRLAPGPVPFLSLFPFVCTYKPRSAAHLNPLRCNSCLCSQTVVNFPVELLKWHERKGSILPPSRVGAIIIRALHFISLLMGEESRLHGRYYHSETAERCDKPAPAYSSPVKLISHHSAGVSMLYAFNAAALPFCALHTIWRVILCVYYTLII